MAKMEFIDGLEDQEAIQALVNELRAMPDHSAPISKGNTKTVGEVIQDLEEGNEVAIEFLALRRRAEKRVQRLKGKE